MAVQWITDQETGGVLQPADHYTKTGDRVMEVLCTKHPNTRPLPAAILDTFTGRPPDLVPVDIMDNTATTVAERLSRGNGPGGRRTW